MNRNQELVLGALEPGAGVDEALKQVIFERLKADPKFGAEWAALVVAALEGADALHAQLTGASGAEITDQDAPEGTSHSPGAYLASLTVEGFRGIGAATSLEVSPGPGLTVIVGRNGSGKSSFAEALELLLTGENKRWSGRSQIWQEGWRNLHHPAAADIEARVLVEGEKSPATLRRSWQSGQGLIEGKLEVSFPGRQVSLSSLGWDDALITYRPFLSYNELGSMLEEGPSKLYDALAKILGLDDLVDAQEVLRKQRLERDKAVKSAQAEARLLLQKLQEQASTDERINAAVGYINQKKWDVEKLESLIAGQSRAEDARQIESLRAVAQLHPPQPDEVGNICQMLRQGAQLLEAVRSTDADRARRVAGLLRDALELHEQHRESDCPVCGNANALDSSWRIRTETEAARLMNEAAEADTAHAEMQRARSRAAALLSGRPAILDTGADVGVDLTDARNAWTSWQQGLATEEPVALATHMEEHITRLDEAVAAVRSSAISELQRREDAWKPIALELAGWLALARDAEDAKQQVGPIKQAEEWLKAATSDLRNERFTPIAEQAKKIWEALRTQSNVDLGAIELSGSGTTRRVALNVTVDGKDGAALGVMSQGELHSLALSLFLPRATLPQSPFRFVVIDDPVQSMDPSRVDGLARVLEDVAGTRQVLVFTHDDRLPQAIRQLQIEATIIQVTRREFSQIELKTARDPVQGYIDDARAVSLTKELPQQAARRVVPGFCRGALEAAFMEKVRRRRLARGEPHLAIEEELAAISKLNDLAALALLDDRTRTQDIFSTLNKFGHWAGDTYRAVRDGAHERYEGNLKNLVDDAESLARKVLAS